MTFEWTKDVWILLEVTDSFQIILTKGLLHLNNTET